MTTKRILYVGPLDAGGTCRSRMEGLQELGHEVISIDTHTYITPWPQVIRAMHNRLLVGPGVWSLNKAILATAHYRLPDILWVDKGIYIWPSTLRRVQRGGGAFVLHHNTDDIKNPRHNFRLYLAALDIYDAHFTSNRLNIEELRAMGGRYVGFSEIGFDHNIFRPMELSSEDRCRWKADVFFIGHWEPESERVIRALAEAGLPVTVSGPGWNKAAGRLPQGIVRGNGVHGDDYVAAINAGQIGLGLVSKWNRNDTAGRIFEVPACGVLLIAERNEATERLYREGYEAEFFSDIPELIEKIREFLKDDKRRARVGGAGRLRCITSGYSWKDRVADMLHQVDRLTG